MKELPPEKVALVKEKMTPAPCRTAGRQPPQREPWPRSVSGAAELAIAVQTIALDAARQEVVAARNEPDMDPEVADRVLRQLDLRTMIMPE